MLCFFLIDVEYYQVSLLMFYSVLISNLTFDGKKQDI